RQDRALLLHVRATLLFDEDYGGRAEVRRRTRHRRRRSVEKGHGSQVEGVCRKGRGGLREGVVQAEGGMTKLLLIPELLGCVLLLGATAVLVRLNWSDRLLTPLFSILLGGTATTFITVT